MPNQWSSREGHTYRFSCELLASHKLDTEACLPAVGGGGGGSATSLSLRWEGSGGRGYCNWVPQAVCNLIKPGAATEEELRAEASIVIQRFPAQRIRGTAQGQSTIVQPRLSLFQATVLKSLAAACRCHRIPGNFIEMQQHGAGVAN